MHPTVICLLQILSLLFYYTALEIPSPAITFAFQASTGIVSLHRIGGCRNLKYLSHYLQLQQFEHQRTNLTPTKRMATTSNGDTTTTTNNGSSTSNDKERVVVGIASKIARSNILELQPYRCARDDYSTGILLDANENSYGPPPSVRKEQSSSSSTKPIIELERYPDPYQIPLKERFIEFRGYNDHLTNSDDDSIKRITADHVFVGVGSDEAIDLLMRIFCIPNVDAIMTTPPTYGMYKVCAKVNDVPIINVPLTPQFDVQIPQIIEAITPNVKLLFLCSPGNPTSKLTPTSDIRTIASHPKIVDKVIVVVDEAYIDFASTPSTTSTNGDDKNNVSAVQLINEFANVVVLQTLSKAFGLAAIRCGFCIGPKDIIQLMNNVKAPYNVNSLTSQLAYEALDTTVTKSSIQDHIIEILQQRDVVVAALQKMDFVTFIYPSDANFVLFRLQTNAYEVYKYMADTENIVTRYRGTELHCSNCIRVTIGTPNENQAFIVALQKAYATITNK